MDGIEPVGVVPDEVLLLCGRPAAVPSGWWTPALAALPARESTALCATATDGLERIGVRDRATGALTGPLGDVAAVVAAAALLLLVETTRSDVVERRSLVVAPDRALLDRQTATAGLHDLVLATPTAACVLLCGLLADGLAAPTAPVRDLVGRRTADEVLAVLPVGARRATLRVMRSRRGDPDGAGHACTVVHHDDGSVACWALPDGALEVVLLDGDDVVVDLAMTLLGAQAAA